MKLLIPGYISVQVEDSKVEQMIYVNVEGETEVKFIKMNRFLSEIQEKYTKLVKIVKISISK